ncbi:class I SAM-dependent methyltransferase [Desulforamulus ruminis]|uniref:Methyltransferase type 11 n=1 Tax=Desulforamulus ruminis (strain ATCC 23193 / DSM 2154 / NCIMB 8452 / DL) TaxID=696281 RepID=F6DM48_DESRL|nr:methyltransferase domain-containing protein [Desulforamulus ruminis]AEG59390.1 Methyltransferase type 11 [Desulforamulus ruminis DSM 2154]
MKKICFQCNICGEICDSDFSQLSREEISCFRCGSTVRMRAIIHLLSMSLFGNSLALPHFPVNDKIKGLGMSDWEGYALPLAQKFNYVNTFYHQEPRLDIVKVEPKWHNQFDFIISSDVFEHVPPPVHIAFENVRKMLKPGGTFIFTVPYSKLSQTTEHFPDLFDYEIIVEKEQKKLINVTRDGHKQVYENLIFHGGSGATLEMRVFSEASLLVHFQEAGFPIVKIHGQSNLKYGIHWEQQWSLPITARVGDLSL